MRIRVAPLALVAQQAREHRPRAVVSLLAPGQEAPAINGGARRLVLAFHDVAAPRADLTPPDRETIGRLLAFGAAVAGEGDLLVHCWLGVSRSPAAAFILACALSPERPEAQIALALRAASPGAQPNPLMVGLADDLLGRGGRMIAAARGIGPGRAERAGEPFELDLTWPARSCSEAR